MGYASLDEALAVGSGIERTFSCPAHQDNHPSASVNALTGWWCCYSCGTWGRVDLDRYEYDPLNVRRMVRRVVEKMTPVHQVYPEGWLSIHDAAGPGGYWSNRFDAATCAHFRLGQTADRDAATIPMRDNTGQVLGVIRRDLTGWGQKYKYPYGVDVTKYVFDLHRTETDVLIVTEGATDAMAIWEAGFNHGVALYGSRLSKAQAQLIRRYQPSRILTAQDQDDAGDGAHELVRRTLGSLFPVDRMVWDTYKDLSSIPVHERREMLTEILQEEPESRVANSDLTRVGSTYANHSD